MTYDLNRRSFVTGLRGYLQDQTTIAFAGLIEHAFGGFTPPPRF